MSIHPATCDPAVLELYLEGQLSDAEQARLEAHVATCANCCTKLSNSAADDSWWQDASRFLPTDDWDGPPSRQYLDTVAPDANLDTTTDRRSLLKRLSPWLDPTDDPHMLGRFGGYEIAGVIGEGGMGIVLKGHEPALNRYVAIKLLAPHLASNGAARQRFSREAQAAAAVLHENVIAIHRVDQSQGLPFLVMPYIGGVSLQKRLDEEGALAIPAILRIARQIAAGLTAAHAQGLVHRDVKPANILLERGVDRVTLTDFGLARTVDDATLTHSGVIAGTPQYMSPEQARGDAMDGRSDLFSLGSVMYAMCTGRAPFRAETPFGILRRITDDAPRPIREINPEIPGWLESIVFRLLAKSMGDRYQSAAAVAELLEQCLAHNQQPTRVPLPEIPPFPQPIRAAAPPRGRSLGTTDLRYRALWIALTIAVPLIAGIALYDQFWPRTPLPLNTQATAPTAPTGTLASESFAEPDAGSEDTSLWHDGVAGTLDDIQATLRQIDTDLDPELAQETQE
ncbi:MAG: protein kinase [Planctomycetes bacterium]|nr:protein kinase [Planctomycetota bacterium]